MLAGFSLVDAGASPQTLLAQPMDGASVEVANPDGGSYAIRADLNEGHTAGSVALELTGRKSASATEGVMAYSLYGDDGAGARRGEALPAGSYVLTMTAYEGSGGGAVLHTPEVSFTVTAAAEETGTGQEDEEDENTAPLTARFLSVLIPQWAHGRTYRLGEVGKHLGIQRISLGELASSLGEVAHLSGVDHYHRQCRRCQSRHRRHLEATGCL